MKDQLLLRFDQWMTLRNFSTATKKLYRSGVLRFWQWCESRQHQAGWNKEDALFQYFSHRMATVSWSTVNSEFSGLKWFYTQVLERPWPLGTILRPRRTQQLPVILSVEDIQLMIRKSGAFRNQVLLLMLYATGMRLGEISRLRIQDINSNRMTLHIHNGKGAKDRIIPLPSEVLPILRIYYLRCRPVEYLFNGDSSGTPLSARMIQRIVQEAKRSAGIKTKVSVHTFRHCFATHLLENGVNLVVIQKLLGHKSLKATSIYLHLSSDYMQNIRNPATPVCQQLWENKDTNKSQSRRQLNTQSVSLCDDGEKAIYNNIALRFISSKLSGILGDAAPAGSEVV